MSKLVMKIGLALMVGVGVVSQIPIKPAPAETKAFSPKYVAMSPEEHRRATGEPSGGEATIAAKDESKSTMTEAERLTLVDIDPEMKKASDYLGFLINSNGYLCAKVSNVEQVSGTKFEITCVKHNSGAGRARYLVDSATNEARPM